MRQFVIKYICCLLLLICFIQYAFAQQPAKAMPKYDSTGKDIQAMKSSAKEKIDKQTVQVSSLTKETKQALIQPEKRLLDSLLRSGKNITQSITAKLNLFKDNAFKINNIHAGIDYNYLKDTSGVSTGALYDIHSTVGYDLGIGLSIANMPFDARLAGNDGIYSFYNTPVSNFPQFNFDHKKYLELLQKQVLDKINPETVLASTLSRINTIKSQYESSLKNEIRKIQQEFQLQYGSMINLPEGVSNLSISDLTSLKSMVIPQSVLEEYKEGNELYQELTSKNGLQPANIDSLKTAALGKIKKQEALEKIYSRIMDWKEKFDNNSVVKELRSHLPFTPGNFRSFIKKPGNLVDVIKAHANLNGIQQLFMNITKLDLGSNPLTGGELNLQNIMNNGINTEFTNKRNSVGLIYGSGNANINQWLQSGLNSFGSNEYSRLTGIKFGSGWNSSIKQSISLNFFDFNSSQDLNRFDPAQMHSGYLSTVARRDAVITWQSSFNVAANHKISVDLSKSFGSYRNSLSPDSTVAKNNAFGDVFSNEGRSNYAFAIDYKGNLLKTDVQLSLKNAGLGYSNPGNVFVRKGETRIGLGISKKFLKQKMTLKYKTDFRSQHFDPEKNYTYDNFSNNLQLGYRLNRNNRFGIAVRHNSYHFNNKYYDQLLNGSSFSLQGDANYLLRVKGKKVINNFSLARQSFDIPMLTGNQYASKTWLITHTSSLLLNENLVTLTVLLNQSNNKDYYFNTSFFNTEIGYSYKAGEQIRLNSGAGFYANTGWNKQIGLKQQISGTIFKKLDIDLDLSWKKAVQITRPELADQVFIRSSVHYRF